MQLDGLEENEDFWKMDLSDDEVPIRDTAPTRSSMLDSMPAARTAVKADMMKGGQGTASSFGGLNTDKQVEEGRPLSRPEKLPNGKYR